MVVLSSMALSAYNCQLNELFYTSPMGYMFYLFYFRSDQCTSPIVWERLGIQNLAEIETVMPAETWAVYRTYVLSIVQLSLNSLLIAASILMLGIIMSRL